MPQSSLSRAVLDHFFSVCNWAHEVWTLRQALFDGNRLKRALARGPHHGFFATLNPALTEYVLLQITKLHDPPVMAGRVCLTIGYIAEYGGWDGPTSRKLARMRLSLDRFVAQIKPARNRVIAHHDLAAALTDQALGEFKRGADRRYFRSLHTFVRAAYVGALGEPCADFSTFSRRDARHVVDVLARSTRE